MLKLTLEKTQLNNLLLKQMLKLTLEETQLNRLLKNAEINS